MGNWPTRGTQCVENVHFVVFLLQMSFQLHHKTRKTPITVGSCTTRSFIFATLPSAHSQLLNTWKQWLSKCQYPFCTETPDSQGEASTEGLESRPRWTFQGISSDTTLQTRQVFSCRKEVGELVGALLFKFMKPKISFQSFLQQDKSADSRRQHAYVEDFRSCHFKEKNVFCWRHNPQPLF